MMKNRYIGIIILTAAIIFGCKKPFNLSVTSNYTNILVVEGVINTGGIDSIFIRLSRTGKVNSAAIIPETKATITVENAQGTILTLTETVSGMYVFPPVVLDNTKQYRLRVKTSNGATYLSDFVDAKVSPPIDSVGYKLTPAGLQIYANTHDPNNNSHFYRYTYRETWQFTAKYPSDFVVELINNVEQIVPRLPSAQVFFCFGSDTSSHTIVNSTAALAQDVAYQFPIITIDPTSEKIESKYSILLTQQALTKEAFEFYENLQKNSEDLGSIFDAQPSQFIGNIHNAANSTEPVIGYITAGTTQQKRIFITKTQIPASFVTVYPYVCPLDSVGIDCGPFAELIHNYCNQFFPNTVLNTPGIEQPLSHFDANPLIQNSEEGYSGSTNICTECTLRGHTTRPVFWK